MSVGVIVPVRGPAPWLAEGLDSVLAQEPPPDAVVVVDDGSNPPVALTPAHAAACSLVRRSERGGPAAARMEGLARLDTDLVAFLDADDAWRPGRLAAAVSALERHPDVALCFGPAEIVGPDGSPTGERWHEPPPGVLTGPALGRVLFEHDPVPTPAVVIRRSVLDGVGGFDVALVHGEDADLWMRLAERGHSFVFEPRAGVRCRRHSGGLTGSVAELTEAGMFVRAAHAGLVDGETRRRVLARDLVALARGRVRQRRYAEARAALSRAGELRPLDPRERLLGVLAGVPGARAALGRRDPYRRRTPT